MKRYFLLLLFCWQHAFAHITVEADPSTVQFGEAFRLIFTIEGQHNNAGPNLSALQQDFTIISTERSMTYSVVNGQTQSINQWIVTLSAKKPGILLIPAIQIGPERSTPLNIEVTTNKLATSSDQQGSIPNDEVLLKTMVNPEGGAYVNQQILYTVKLYNSEQLLDAEYQPPSVDDALIVPLGDSQRTQSIINGHNYIVEEQQYAIFPQKSGALVIHPPSFTALIFDSMPRRVNVHTTETKLVVKPIPIKYSGKYWLPAKQIALTEMYDQMGTTFSQGSTLIRKVTLQAAGIPAQLLPTLEFASNSQFNVYPEKPELSNGARQHDLVARMEVKVTYLLNKEGTVTIPALQIPWFNTDTGKEEMTTLPERTLTITAKAGHAANPTPTVSSPQKTPVLPPISSSWKPIWWIALGFILALFIIASLLWAYRTSSGTRARKSLVLKKLQQACKNNNAEQAQSLLLRWANLYFPDEDIISLHQLAKLLHDVSLKKQFALLSEILYSKERSRGWHGEELWRSLMNYLRVKPTKKKKINKLPPINPIG